MAFQAPQTSEAQQPAQNNSVTNEFDGEDLDVDDSADTDSAYGSSVASETTTIASHYRGYVENGRTYQNVSNKEYFQPTDEKQWDAMEKGHLLFLILDSQRTNPLFRSPISSKAQNIIDLGTGKGDWALDVADRYPNITVRGVDLMAPPREFTAPNCIFEVDDIGREWTWNHKFDLVHMRHLLGAFSHAGFDALYKRIYNNLEPGGWIEQVEADIGIYCMDDSLPKDSILNFREMWFEICEKSDRPIDTEERMEGRIRAAGFTNVQRQDYKVPIGTWPKLPVYKDAGRVSQQQFLSGVEGWCMYLLTKWGLPKPWTVEEVQVWLAKVRNEVHKGYPIYHKYTRVWAQKPFDEQSKVAQQPEVVNVEESPMEAPKEASAEPLSETPAKKQRAGTEVVAKEA